MYTCVHAYMGVCVSMSTCKNVCGWGVCVCVCMYGGMLTYAWMCVVEGWGGEVDR